MVNEILCTYFLQCTACIINEHCDLICHVLILDMGIKHNVPKPFLSFEGVGTPD